MSLPSWNDYEQGANTSSLPSWDNYNSEQQTQTLPEWDNENGNVNLDVIQQIESNGDNEASSGAGAKGLYQFMPETSKQYSKRLFGKSVSDASTLSPEQQKQMSNAYFNDLLKEFNGDPDKAIAAYNWGLGNVEKDIKANGEDWKEHLPAETEHYLDKYHRLSKEGGSNYDHASKPNQGGWEGSKEYMSNQWQQLKDLGKGANAEIHKALGADYNEEDIEEMKDALNSGEGKTMKTSAAVAASMLAPELLPELAGEGMAVKGANWLGKGLASSLAYQGVDKGDVSLKDTASDIATGAAFEGGLRLLAKPVAKQLKNAVEGLTEASTSNPELEDAVKRYLGASRAEELGKNWSNLRETDSQATLLDAYDYMGEQVPDVWKSGAIEDVKPYVRGFKNNGSHTELIDSAKTAKQGAYEEAKQLAKSDADKRLLANVADANESMNGIAIPDDALASTPLQKAGATMQDWLGYGVPKSIKARQAREALKPETEAMIKRLQGDNRRITREFKNLEGKHGASITAKSGAMNRQRNANNKMIDYLRNGMSGKKIKIADIQTAIKDVQEEQFSTGKFKGITQDFKKLADKYDVAQAYNLESEKGFVSDLAKHGLKHMVHLAGMGTIAPAAIATGAGMLAKNAKASNLQFVKEIVEAVKSGAMSEEQAATAIAEHTTRNTGKVSRSASTLREMIQD